MQIWPDNLHPIFESFLPKVLIAPAESMCVTQKLSWICYYGRAMMRTDNLLYLLSLMTLKCCGMYLRKQNCVLKTFPTTFILMTQVFLYPIFASRTNLKLHNISVTLKSYQPWFVKGIWPRLHSSDSFEKLSAWTCIQTSWTLQYLCEGILFSRLLEGFTCGFCI